MWIIVFYTLATGQVTSQGDGEYISKPACERAAKSEYDKRVRNLKDSIKSLDEDILRATKNHKKLQAGTYVFRDKSERQELQFQPNFFKDAAEIQRGLQKRMADGLKGLLQGEIKFKCIKK